MSLLTSMLVYLIVGCGEWYLALRRTLACARGEKVVLVSIVFIENLLGLWVLSNFVRTNNWLLALSYASGASAGALIVAMNSQKATTATEVVQAVDRAAASVADDSPVIPVVRRQPSRRRIAGRSPIPPQGKAGPESTNPWAAAYRAYPNQNRPASAIRCDSPPEKFQATAANLG
jgi:hypothetical protein